MSGGVNRVTKAVLEAEVRSFIADMERAAEAAADVGRKTESAARQATRAQREQSTAAKQVAREQAEAARKGRAAFDETAQTAARGAIAVGAAIGLMGKAAVDWESAWAGVTKSVAGAGQEMEDSLRGLAKTLPATHDDIAAVAEAAGQLGVKTGDVVGFTETMIKLGETTNLTADEAATSIAQISNVMGTLDREGTAGVDRFANALVALGNNGASTERDILSMSSRIAGAAKVVGMTEADLLGVANAVSSVGIEAEAGGTAISNVLIDMSKAVKTGSDDLERFARVAGISADDFARAFSESPADAMNLFVKGLGRIQQTGGDVFTVLDDLGQSDVRVTSALLKMAGAGDLLTESLQTGRSAAEQNSAMQAEFAKRLDTTAARLAIARNNARDAAITLGDSLAPMAAAAADGLSKVAQFAADLPAPLRNGALAVAGIGSAGILAAAGVGKVAQAGRSASEAFDWISKRGPRAEKAMLGVQRAGVGVGKALGVAMAVGTVGGLLVGHSEWGGVDKLTQDLLSSTDALSVWDRQIAESTNRIGTMDESVNSLSEVFTAAFDPTRYQSTSNGINSVFNAVTLGMVNNESAISQANQALDQMDATLASIYAQNPDAAAQQFQVLADAAAAQGVSFDDLMDKLPKYEGAMAAAANQTRLAGDSATGASGDLSAFGGELTSAGQTAEDAAKSMDDLVSSLQDLGAELLGQRGSARDFQAAIDDATASLKENGETLDINTDAGRANQAALDNIASSTANWAAKSAEAGASASEVAGILSKGRKAFLDFAADAGMSAGEARKLADSMGLVPSEVDTLFSTTGAAESQEAAQDLISTYFGAPKRVDTIFDTPGAVESQEQAATTKHFYEMVPDQVTTPFSTPGAAESAKAAWGVESNIRSIPKSWSSQITVSGADAAANAAWRVKTALDSIPRHVGSTVLVNSISHNIPRARGALMRDGVSAYAGGGISLATGQVVPRVPQIAKGGTYALWAERKTGWEAYISGLPAERDRNVRIWQDAGRLLGMPDWLLAAATARQYAAGELQGRYVSQSAYDDATRHGVAVDQGWQRRMLRQELDGLEVVMDGYRVGRLTQRAQGARRL
jgi:TP901 family phage tail tape measure protein